MKVVQSFWSKPLMNAKFSETKKYAGWPSLEVFLSCWAFSCLTIKRFYPDICLITDALGKKVFMDILKLPYTNCETQFDELDVFGTDLWAIGKMKAYSLQDEPFIHIDGDVFLWDHLDQNITSKAVFVQSLEKDPLLYDTVLAEVKRELDGFPKEASKFFNDKEGNSGWNTGVFGGNDIDFIKHYANEVLSFVEKNKEQLTKHQIKNINMFFEQYLLLCFAKYHKKEISVLFEDMSNDFSEVLNFHLVPNYSSYIHIVGKAKWDSFANDQIILRLKMEFPEYYEKVKKALPHIEKLIS